MMTNKITDKQAQDILMAMSEAVENNPELDDAPIERISGFAVEFVLNEVARLSDDQPIFDPNLFELATLILSDCGISENNQPLYDRVLGRLINARLPIVAPTEQQILEATEKAGLWPNTVRAWLPAFHRYHVELAVMLNKNEVEKCTNSDSWNCKYCRQTETCKALNDPRNYEGLVTPQPASKYIFQEHDDYVSFEDDTMHTATINILENGETHWAAIAIHGKGKDQAVARRDHVLRALQSQVHQKFCDENYSYDGLQADLEASGNAGLTESEMRENNSAFNAAIEYALNNHDLEFLRVWFHGNFDAIRKEWSDAPEAVFIGADPLHPKTKGELK